MPTAPHIEKHFTATETVRDIVIGMSDGLTVPFALAAGLSAAVADLHVIVLPASPRWQPERSQWVSGAF